MGLVQRRGDISSLSARRWEPQWYREVPWVPAKRAALGALALLVTSPGRNICPIGGLSAVRSWVGAALNEYFMDIDVANFFPRIED